MDEEETNDTFFKSNISHCVYEFRCFLSQFNLQISFPASDLIFEHEMQLFQTPQCA